MHSVLRPIGVPLLALGLFAAPGPPLGAQSTFRTSVDIVAVGATVFDGQGRLVPDLTKDDFEVYEDGVRQTVRVFAHGLGPTEELPIRLGLLFDRSASLERDILLERAAAIRFVERVPGVDQITLVEFDT